MPAHAVTCKPAEASWEEAASLPAVGATVWAAVNAAAPKGGETVVVSAAAGGVGFFAAPLTMLRGGVVIGTASEATRVRRTPGGGGGAGRLPDTNSLELLHRYLRDSGLDDADARSRSAAIDAFVLGVPTPPRGPAFRTRRLR
nr:hypothetical protein OG999_29585 [Streptomyces sp. NBC_00886]